MFTPWPLIVVALLGILGLLALALATNGTIKRIGELVFHACLVVVLLAVVFGHHG